MIPLKDDNPSVRRPLVTLVIIAACVVVYFFVQPIGQVVPFRCRSIRECPLQARALPLDLELDRATALQEAQRDVIRLLAGFDSPYG